MGNLQTSATWGTPEIGQKQTTQWAIYRSQQHGERQRQDKNKQHNGQSTDTSNMGRARGRTKTSNTMGNLQTPATWGGLEAGQKQTTQWAIYRHQQHGEG